MSQTIDPSALFGAQARAPNGSAPVANGALDKGKGRADADGADAAPPTVDPARLEKERCVAGLSAAPASALPALWLTLRQRPR